MRKKLEVYNNKALRLDNVIMKQIINTLAINEEDEAVMENNLLDVVVTQMGNQIQSKGASIVGPLIQYSGIEHSDNEMGISMFLMLQANRYIDDVDPGFKMEPVIKVPDCMYIRFEGREEDLEIAYRKIEVEAYESEIVLKGNCYTIFVDADDVGNIVADIFMEKESEL